MALPLKTMELIERIAGKLETWAKSWGTRLLKDRPNSLDFRQFLSAEFGSAHIPQVAFVLEFCSGLNEALEGFDYIREELQHYMPNMAEPVQKKHDDLIIEAESIGQVTTNNATWFKKFNGSRKSAISLAKTLHHILEMANENVSPEKLKDGVIQPEIPTRRVPLTKAAEWFGCDYRTLRKDIESGKIKAKRFSDRRWEFDLDQVTEFNLSVRADADPTECGKTS